MRVEGRKRGGDLGVSGGNRWPSTATVMKVAADQNEGKGGEEGGSRVFSLNRQQK